MSSFLLECKKKNYSKNMLRNENVFGSFFVFLIYFLTILLKCKKKLTHISFG